MLQCYMHASVVTVAYIVWVGHGVIDPSNRSLNPQKKDNNI